MTTYDRTSRTLLLAAWLLGGAAAHVAADGDDAESVTHAITASVRALMGPVDAVHVTAVSTFASASSGGVRAVPEVGARTSSPARFLLFQGRTRVGYAVATVVVEGPHVRARRPLARDQAIGDEDVEEARGELRALLFQRVPQLADLRGAQPVRTIAAGETLSGTVVRVPPVVRVGDAVRATLRADGVEVTALVLAAGSGRIGDVIRVRGGANRRYLNARVTAHGAVEVMP